METLAPDYLALISLILVPLTPHITALPSVESNDVLYGGSTDYMEELQEHKATVMQEVISQLTELRESQDRAVKIRQTELVLQLVNQLITTYKLDAAVFSFVIKLMELAKKSKDILPKKDMVLFESTTEILAMQRPA